MRYGTSRQAKEELGEALAYYVEHSLDAADRFVIEYDATISAIRDNPERFATFLPEFLGDKYRSKRIEGFPYSVVYRLRSDEILVVAIPHASREPGYWTRQK